MAQGHAPALISLQSSLGGGSVATQALLSAMLRSHRDVSDLIFSPGRLPQVEIHGQLNTLDIDGLRALTADDTRRIASELIGDNKQAVTMLREQGSCDISYALPGVARFRVNIFIQRGSCAIVMRVIPTQVPDFDGLKLPQHLKEVANLRDGIVLVTGPRNSGKSSTLAALLNCINEQQTHHVITIEDPIEFLHNHKRATIHQRELHSDAPNFAVALRAALRQAPKVILLGEMRDRETMEMALEAAETGHLVLSTLNTVDAVKTIGRFTSVFAASEHSSVRARLAKVLRYVISQRLIPRKDVEGRIVAVEILKVAPSLLALLECEDPSGHNLLEAMKNGHTEGMQHFDVEIEKLVRTNIVDLETALTYATDTQQLRQSLQAEVAK
ncbi:MAG TPA: PilT/PilU family type 4a pilus ATPase [Terriglobales bacterium]|jgi:twitching motility protein PilT